MQQRREFLMSLVAAGLVPQSLLAAEPAKQEEVVNAFSLDKLAESIRNRHKTSRDVSPKWVEIFKNSRLNEWISIQHQRVEQTEDGTELPISDGMLVFWMEYRYGLSHTPIEINGKKSKIPEIDIRIEMERVEFERIFLEGSFEYIVLREFRHQLPLFEDRRFEDDKDELNRFRNEIHRDTIRGAANFIVTAEGVTLPRLEGPIKQYASKYMPKDEILVGWKGCNYLEAGAVLAVGKEDPEEGLHYTFKIINPQMYRRVRWTSQQ